MKILICLKLSIIVSEGFYGRIQKMTVWRIPVIPVWHITVFKASPNNWEIISLWNRKAICHLHVLAFSWSARVLKCFHLGWDGFGTESVLRTHGDSLTGDRERCMLFWRLCLLASSVTSPGTHIPLGSSSLSEQFLLLVKDCAIVNCHKHSMADGYQRTLGPWQETSDPCWFLSNQTQQNPHSLLAKVLTVILAW